MNFCPKCGYQVGEGERFCTQCGNDMMPEQKNTAEAPVAEPVATYQAPLEEPAVVVETPAQEPKKGLNVGMLVWSILNVVLGCGIGSTLGIGGIVFTILSAVKSGATADKFLRFAKRFNLSATIVSVVLWMIYILYYIFIFVLGVAGGLFEELM